MKATKLPRGWVAIKVNHLERLIEGASNDLSAIEYHNGNGKWIRWQRAAIDAGQKALHEWETRIKREWLKP